MSSIYLWPRYNRHCCRHRRRCHDVSDFFLRNPQSSFNNSHLVRPRHPITGLEEEEEEDEDEGKEIDGCTGQVEADGWRRGEKKWKRNCALELMNAI